MEPDPRISSSTSPPTSFARRRSSKTTADGFTSRPARRSPRRSWRISCWPRTEAARTIRCSGTTACAFRDVSHFGFKLEKDLKEFLARGERAFASVSSAKPSSTSGSTVVVTNLSQKSRCVAGRERAQRIRQIGAPASSLFISRISLSEVHCLHQRPRSSTFRERTDDAGSPTASLVKTRFVDQRKRVPALRGEESSISLDVRAATCRRLRRYDLVLIADFRPWPGSTARAIEPSDRGEAARAFVAAMAQVNSSNYGYNLPTKYRGADYFSLNRTEERSCACANAASRRRNCEAHGMPARLQGAVGDRWQAGRDSCGSATKPRRCRRSAPASIDTIGCGDAYFSLSSLAACLRLPARMVALVGSIGAAAMTQRRCNERPVTEQEFMTIAKIVI